MTKKTVQTLQTAKLKVTDARRRVLQIFLKAKKPLDVDQVLKELVKNDIIVDQATVYRIMKAFTEKEILHQISLEPGKSHYELSDRPHHHHILCTSCGLIRDIEGCVIDAMEAEAATKTGFVVRSHSFELFGVCSSCQRS